MYATSKIGPWPVMDIASSKLSQTTAVTSTGFGSKLNCFLVTQALGSSTEAYMNLYHSAAGVYTVAGDSQATTAILLKPLEDVIKGDEPVYIDYSFAVNTGYNDTVGSTNNLQFAAFLGYVDSGATPVAGYDATNNGVTNYHFIPGMDRDNMFTGSGQILIKTIVSANQPTNQYLAFGICIRNVGGSTDFDSADVMLSARYSTEALNTSYRGV